MFTYTVCTTCTSAHAVAMDSQQEEAALSPSCTYIMYNMHIGLLYNTLFLSNLLLELRNLVQALLY